MSTMPDHLLHAKGAASLDECADAVRGTLAWALDVAEVPRERRLIEVGRRVVAINLRLDPTMLRHLRNLEILA
jgi:hypothetical protein